MSGSVSSLAYTGATGSIGSQMPAGAAVPLRTRLEAPVEQMVEELRAVAPEVRSLIHLAALVPVPDCEKDPARARALNVDGSVKWFRAAASVGCRRFVYVSSAHVFAAPPDRQKLTVDSPTGPRSVYASTKLEAEEALRAEASKPGGIELVIARVFGVLSQAMRPGYLLTRLHERARARDFSPIPGLSNVRDFMDAADIARELVRLAQVPGSLQPMVLICTGRETTVRQIAEKVYREHGLDPSNLRETPGRPDDVPYMVGEPTRF